MLITISSRSAGLSWPGPTVMTVDYKIQKAVICETLQQQLKQGDIW